MLYKLPVVEAQFHEQLHPDTRTVLVEFGAFSAEAKLPEPLLTEVVRSEASMVEYYVPYAERLIAELAAGKLTAAGDIRIATDLTQRTQGLTPEQRRKVLESWALGRFSWHLVRCAGDLRTIVPETGRPYYTPAQLGQADQWFRRRLHVPAGVVQSGAFEYLIHDVTAPHIHVGRRDFAWRSRYGTKGA